MTTIEQLIQEFPAGDNRLCLVGLPRSGINLLQDVILEKVQPTTVLQLEDFFAWDSPRKTLFKLDESGMIVGEYYMRESDPIKELHERVDILKGSNHMQPAIIKQYFMDGPIHSSKSVDTINKSDFQFVLVERDPVEQVISHYFALVQNGIFGAYSGGSVEVYIPQLKSIMVNTIMSKLEGEVALSGIAHSVVSYAEIVEYSTNNCSAAVMTSERERLPEDPYSNIINADEVRAVLDKYSDVETYIRSTLV